jgi:signal transduction histidine kinase
MLQALPPAPDDRADRIDWRVVLMALPRRRFTADELARIGAGSLSRTLRVSVAFNLLLPTLVVLLVFGRELSLALVLLLGAFLAALVATGLAAWRNPSAPAVRLAYWVLPIACGGVFGWVLQDADAATRPSALAVMMLMLMGALGLWFAIVHRHQYIEMRLAELAERERAVEMARRLAAAQIEPHFLFNTLASLQHWVQTQDGRAATLLDALTGYLRATLPMFARPTIALADELEAVRRYLQVMQARLGERLAFEIDAEPALAALPLPPGLLLTLVENAVEHGIEPRLAGGRVRVTARREGERALVEVHDDGPGPAVGQAEGLGLANCRERLALTHGGAATLVIGADPAGGCRATLSLPWRADA